ncbi:hypothetical protein Tcan_10042 [Toxocara canis]|uniref:Uncharacterized protein n=1 Tax=Toxocara canis TaxID=6265 RepID=A0A0B2VW88_TOXCA|nr:hypothetical protein Tcan_10042 [Toxocara canis]
MSVYAINNASDGFASVVDVFRPLTMCSVFRSPCIMPKTVVKGTFQRVRGSFYGIDARELIVLTLFFKRVLCFITVSLFSLYNYWAIESVGRLRQAELFVRDNACFAELFDASSAIWSPIGFVLVDVIVGVRYGRLRLLTLTSRFIT